MEAVTTLGEVARSDYWEGHAGRWVRGLVDAMLVAAVGALVVGAAHGATAASRPSRIAFGIESGSLSSIYTVRPNGTGLRRLTVPPTRQGLGGDSGPAWSPDGRRLVFERNLPYWGTDRFRLASVPAAGGLTRRLTSGPYDAMPTFSPNGQRIAFVRLTRSVPETSVSLYTIDRLGRRAAPLLSDGFDISPDWSPDGTTIAFSRLADDSLPIEESTLYLADASGSNVRPLGDAPVKGVSPAWSPDGHRLAFVSFADHNGAICPADSCPPSGEIYVVGDDGKGLTRLTMSKADDEHPTWSPDGSRIAFASGFALRRQGHLSWLVTVSANGGRATRIGRFSGVLDPAWSPAGVR
jgi:Tol biopolymer transport system component